MRDSPLGGHLSFVAASNAAGPTATAAGPGSHYGPHQLQLLSLYLSLYSTDYLTDHSSPSETSLKVCEDLPSKLDTESCCAGLRNKFSRPVSKRVSSCFLRETKFSFFIALREGRTLRERAFLLLSYSSNSPFNLVQKSPFRPRPSASLVFLCQPRVPRAGSFDSPPSSPASHSGGSGGDFNVVEVGWWL